MTVPTSINGCKQSECNDLLSYMCFCMVSDYAVRHVYEFVENDC